MSIARNIIKIISINEDGNREIPIVEPGEDFKYGWLFPEIYDNDETTIFATYEEAKVLWNEISVSKTGKQLQCPFCGIKFMMRKPKKALDCHDSHLDENEKIKVPLDYKFATLDPVYWVGKKVGGKLDYGRNYGAILTHVFEQEKYGPVYQSYKNRVDFSEFDLDVDPAKFVDQSKYLKL